jgi:hypothetical protein
LAIFGLDYDAKGQKKAERGIAGLRNQAELLQGAFTQILGAAAIASPFVLLNKMASDAQENLNLLQLAFGENADQIVAWSDETAPAIGRSRYTLRELAAEFGGLLQPMVGTNETLAEMSTGLAQLAVDLSSARNVPENEALSALQSGLAGNIIALKRFGVNLNQTRVQQEALARGLSKNTKNLTQAQLATIRYSIIMKDLKFIQGDAKNTLDQFANSSRAVRDALKDIGTELGFFFLPAAEDGLKAVRGWLRPLADNVAKFREWTANSNLAQGALLGVATVLSALLLPLLLKIAPLLLAFAAFALIMDDVITTFQGGESVLRDFTKWLDRAEKEGFEGFNAAASTAIWLFNRFRDILGAVGYAVYALYESLTTGDWSVFQRSIEAIVGPFVIWEERIQKVITAIKSLINTALKPLRSALQSDFVQTVTSPVRALGNLLSPSVQNQATGGGALTSSSALSGGGLASRQVTVNEGGRTYNFELHQQAGESSDDFMQRIRDIVDQSNDERDQALYQELVQQPG